MGRVPSQPWLLHLRFFFVGSTAFHANGSREDVIPHWADVGFLYTVAAAIVFHVWGELAWVLMVGMIIAGVFTLFVGTISAVIPVAIATVLTAIGIGLNFGWGATLAPIGLAVIGFVVRYLSEKVERFEDVLHGLWHLFISAAVYVAWLTTQFSDPLAGCTLWAFCQ